LRTMYHMSIYPAMILMLSREQHKPLSFFFTGLQKDDEGHDPSSLDLEIQLLQDQRDGKIYTIGECNNMDKRGACMGHPLEEEK
jgi:hypothetical protein